MTLHSPDEGWFCPTEIFDQNKYNTSVFSCLINPASLSAASQSLNQWSSFRALKASTDPLCSTIVVSIDSTFSPFYILIICEEITYFCYFRDETFYFGIRGKGGGGGGGRNKVKFPSARRLTKKIMHSKSREKGRRGGAVVRALASHQCGPGSTRTGVICGSSLLLVIMLAPRVFLRVQSSLFLPFQCFASFCYLVPKRS